MLRGQSKVNGPRCWGKKKRAGLRGRVHSGLGRRRVGRHSAEGGFDWVGEGAVAGVDIAAASSPETGETGSLGFYRAGVE